MTHIAKLPMMGILIILFLMTIPPATPNFTETLQPGFSQALIALHNAESAGASTNETSSLVTLLNRALELNREALNLNSTEQDRRNILLAQVNQTLTLEENQAVQITSLAAQRTYINKIITYLSAAVIAILGTIIFAFTLSFYRTYRMRRTFQMKASLR